MAACCKTFFTFAIHSVLEDLAGNRIGVPFDVDLERSIESKAPTETQVIVFEPEQ